MNQNPEDQLKEIRSLMERSTRFVSLSGWTGIMAGIYALAGATAAYYVIFKMNFLPDNPPAGIATYGSGRAVHYHYDNGLAELFSEKNLILALIAVLVFSFSAGTALYHSSVKARMQNVKLWNSTTKRLFVQLAIPVITGGFFCVALLFYGNAGLIAPAMLIFYGLALLNGSKYTLKELHSLALCEIALGLVSFFFIGYGLYFWAAGFGVLHIIYGILMQKRYK